MDNQRRQELARQVLSNELFEEILEEFINTSLGTMERAPIEDDRSRLKGSVELNVLRLFKAHFESLIEE